VRILSGATYVSEGLGLIEQNPSWLEETGFVPSIYWYTQAQVSYLTGPSVLEMALYWVRVETLAGTYVDRQGLAIPNKKEWVKHFIADKGYTVGSGISWIKSLTTGIRRGMLYSMKGSNS